MASALANFGVDENADALIDLLCDREWWVRFRAAESLTQSKHIKSIQNHVKKREDRYAQEMLQFALDKQALRSRKGVA